MDELNPSSIIFYLFTSWSQLSFSTVFLSWSTICFKCFWRHKSHFFYRQSECKVPITLWNTCLTNIWSGQIDFISIPCQIVSPSVSSPACCTAVITHCLLPLSVLHSRQVILVLYFQVTLCDKRYEMYSRSTDTIAFIAVTVTLNFPIFFF